MKKKPQRNGRKRLVICSLENKTEITEKVKEMAKNYGKSDDKEFMENENVRNYIKSGVESEKALEFLVKNAKIK